MVGTTRNKWILSLALMAAIVGVGLWYVTSDPGTGTAASVDGDETAEAMVPERDADREPIPLDFEGPIAMTVYQAPTCGCCGGWVEHVAEHGFEPESEMTPDMASVKEGFAIPDGLDSCHTAVVEGYIIEGHVPAGDIRRLLAEAPQARGLTVPGMPVGSPGMEMGDRIDRYDVLLFDEAGNTTVWASYGES